MNHVKLSKNMILEQRNWKTTKIAIDMNLWKYGQILTIQKTLIIKWLKFSSKIFLIWIYHLILDHILNSNNKFGMWINIIFFHFVIVLSLVQIFWFQKSITTNKWIFYQ